MPVASYDDICFFFAILILVQSRWAVTRKSSCFCWERGDFIIDFVGVLVQCYQCNGPLKRNKDDL